MHSAWTQGIEDPKSVNRAVFSGALEIAKLIQDRRLATFVRVHAGEGHMALGLAAIMISLTMTGVAVYVKMRARAQNHWEKARLL